MSPKWLFFPSQAGGIIDTLTVGDTEVFESADTSYISITRMSDSQAIVCYSDVGNSNYGTASLLSISGGVISVEDTEVFESATTSYISVTAIDGTHAVVCYRDEGNSNYGTASLLSISESAISVEDTEVFESADTTYISAVTMDSTHAIVCYNDGGNSTYGTACCLSFADSAITAGSPTVFNSAQTDTISVYTIDSARAIVSYRTGGAAGKTCCLSLSETTITAGTAQEFGSGTVYDISVCALSTSQALVTYYDSGKSYKCMMSLVGINSTTLSVGTPAEFDSSISLMKISKLNESQAVMIYKDDGNNQYGTALILTVDGSNITSAGEVVFESAASTYLSISLLSSNRHIVAYKDGGNSSYGTATLITAS